MTHRRHTGRTYCKFCVATCGVLVDVDEDGTVLAIRGDPDHPVSHGYLCPKGRAIGQLHHHPERLDEPTIASVAAGWGVVLDDLAARLRPVAVSILLRSYLRGDNSWFNASHRRSR